MEETFRRSAAQGDIATEDFMHRKIKIILNPMADMGNAWRVARDLRSITEDHGGVDWSGTVYPGHAIDLAKQAEEGHIQRRRHLVGVLRGLFVGR